MLYPKLLQILREHPELGRFRKTLTGGCCRVPTDRDIQMRAQDFLIAMPQYRETLQPLLNPPK